MIGLLLSTRFPSGKTVEMLAWKHNYRTNRGKNIGNRKA